jgi:dipeptidyl aminopeptidase/acylaminoacyl peptidase
MSATPLTTIEPRDLVGQRLSHFLVREVIGRGGMGVVYKAEDEMLRRVVALKVLPPTYVGSQEKRQRFLREARTAAALTHPNIATVYEIGEADGTVFIAMELVPGKPLRDVMRGEAMPPMRALGLGVEIARALARAHLGGVVHRDLKPENVMVDGDNVKLLDFGIAKPLRDSGDGVLDIGSAPTASVTAEGALVGTPEYMSPEQLRSEGLTPRSDVFAFGVLLYEMLTGHRPFLRPSLLETAAAIWKEDPPKIAELAPAVPPEASAIVERCLQKKPDARFADAEEVLAALRALTGAASSANRTAPPPPRARRGPWLAVAAMAALVVAGVVALRASWRVTSNGGGAPSDSASAPAPVASARTHLVERRVPGSGDAPPYNALLSPDATMVAYQERDAAYLTPSSGGPRRELPLPSAGASFGRLAGFSPEGDLLAVFVVADQEALWAFRPSDGTMREVSHVHGAALVSPDGKKLLVSRDGTLWVEPLAGGQAVRLATLRSGTGVDIAWSPASDAIAYGEMDLARVGTISIVTADGRRTERIVSDAALVNRAGDVPVAWPRVDALMTAFERPPGSVIVEIPLDAGYALAGSPRNVHVLPDAHVGGLGTAKGVVLLQKQRTEDDVFVGTFAPDLSRLSSPLERLTVDDARDVPVGWLDDGRVLFRSDRDGRDGLFAQAAPGAPSQRAAPADVVGGGVTSGQGVLGWDRPDAGGACSLARLESSGDPRPLFAAADAQAEDSDVVRCMSEVRCAGHGVCVAEERLSDATRWFSFDPATGKKKALVHELAHWARGWDLSPSGDTLAYTTGSDAAVHFASLATHDVRRVAFTVGQNADMLVQFVVYTPDSRHFVLTAMRRARSEGGDYMLLTADDHGAAKLVATTRDSWFNYPYLDAHGLRVAVGEREFQERLWLLEPTP